MRFAIVIASRNSVSSLGEALCSVQSQTRRADELWIVDDDSSDGTEEFVRAWNQPLNYVRLKKNRGPGAARNEILPYIGADWMLPLDSDDRLLPCALEEFQNRVRSTRADLLYGDIWEVKGHRRRLVSYPPIPKGSQGAQFILKRPRIPFKHSACLFRLSALRELGGYDERLALKIDIELVTRLLSAGRLVEPIRTPVLEHFIHPAQMSRRRAEGLACFFKIILKLSLPKINAASLLARRCFWESGKALCGR